MDCRQVEQAISSQQRLTAPRFSPPVLAHLEQCVACRELVLFLAECDPAPGPSGIFLHDLEHRILLDLKPVRPIPSALHCGAGFAATFLALVAFGAWRLNAGAVGAMSSLLCGSILLALGLSAVLLIGSLVRQMVPGSQYRIRPGLLPLYTLAMLCGLFSAVLPHRPEPDFWRAGWICLLCGLGFFVPAAIVFWLLLRQGAVLSPRLTFATMGLLAGLTGTTVLEIHCPLQTAWHVVTWHLGVPVVGMAACLVLAILAGPYAHARLERAPKRGPRIE